MSYDKVIIQGSKKTWTNNFNYQSPASKTTFDSSI